MPRPTRTALFVDFDNVFGSLYDIRPSAADVFGMHPNTWLPFFERGQHAGGRGAEHEPRSILMRKCYMNPDGFITSRGPAKRDDDDSGLRSDRIPETAANSDRPVEFRKFRRFFTSAGFSVIDCPALTSRAKNSADIVMVMDIMAALAHKVEIEEFIILSADADFTPVLIHLREHDRRTAVYANKFTAVAYRAASNVLIGEHDFMLRALGVGVARPAPRPLAPPAAPVQPQPGVQVPLGAIAREVGEEVTRVGSVTIADLVRFLGRFPAFTDQTMPRWLGCGTASRLMTELARTNPIIMLADPSTENIRLVPRPPLTGEAAAAFIPRALQAIHDYLAAVDGPVLLSTLASAVRKQVTDLPARRWPNADTFRDFLIATADPGIMVSAGMPAMAYDPVRHAPPGTTNGSAPEQPPAGAEAWSVPGMPPLLRPEPEASDAAMRPAARQSPVASSPASRSRGAGYAPRVLQAVHEILAASDIPVLLSLMGSLVRQRVTDLPPRWWPGGGTLQAFLSSSKDPRIKLLLHPRAFVYDPALHDPATAPASGSGRAPERAGEPAPAADVEQPAAYDAASSAAPLAAEPWAFARTPPFLHDPIIPKATEAEADLATARPEPNAAEIWADASQPRLTRDHAEVSETIAVPPAPEPDIVPAAGETDSQMVLRVLHARLDVTDAPLALDELDEALRASLPAAACWPEGAESLEAFIRISGDPNLGILPIDPYFVFDRMRHDPYSLTVTDADGTEYPSPALRSLVEMVGEITECPRPSPERHRILWRALTEELRDLTIDLQGQWGLHELELAVETRCQDLGTRLSRPTIRYVIDSLAGQGALTMPVDGDTPRRLAAAYADYLAELCRVNRETLSATELTMLQLWVDPDCEIDRTVDDLGAPSASDYEVKADSHGPDPAGGNGLDPHRAADHYGDDGDRAAREPQDETEGPPVPNDDGHVLTATPAGTAPPRNFDEGWEVP